MTNRQTTALKQRFNLMLSERRINKLQQLALEKDKTMTQIIEELLDAVEKIDKNRTTFIRTIMRGRRRLLDGLRSGSESSSVRLSDFY